MLRQTMKKIGFRLVRSALDRVDEEFKRIYKSDNGAYRCGIIRLTEPYFFYAPIVI